MNKVFEFSLDELMLTKIKRPIRNTTDIITLLLETMQYLSWNKPCGSAPISMKIIVNKMNRIFYVLDKKYFSITMPFSIRKNSDGFVELYDSDIVIDSKRLAIITSIFERIQSEPELDFLKYEEYLDDEELDKDELAAVRHVITKLVFNEYGYLRYDDDAEHENGDLHPRYHLDINCSASGTYKLGLRQGVDFNWFRDCLDVTVSCKFLQA